MTKTKITFCQLLSRKSYSPLRSNAAAAAVCTVQQHSHARAAPQHAVLCSMRRTEGQMISERIWGVLKFSKKATKYCQDICPNNGNFLHQIINNH